MHKMCIKYRVKLSCSGMCVRIRMLMSPCSALKIVDPIISISIILHVGSNLFVLLKVSLFILIAIPLRLAAIGQDGISVPRRIESVIVANLKNNKLAGQACAGTTHALFLRINCV